METKEPESTQELRGKTDKSLEEERDKTDEYLERNAKTVEEETSDRIRLDRFAADKDRESQRVEMDIEKEHRLDETGIQTSRLDDKSLIQERERSDKAQKVERKQEDRARIRERLQKRFLTEAFLDKKREETDSHLLDERDHTDLESEHYSNLLSDEIVSHDLTEAALLSRDQYLSIVSHDLHTPLVSISIGAHLMRRSLSKDPVDKVSLLENIEIIEQSAAGMDQMISDLLEVERMAQDKLILKPERVDLRDLIQECVDLFAPLISLKAMSMIIDICPEPIFADLDYNRILRVLFNLIGNSLKFTPKEAPLSFLYGDRRLRLKFR